MDGGEGKSELHYVLLFVLFAEQEAILLGEWVGEDEVLDGRLFHFAFEVQNVDFLLFVECRLLVHHTDR